MIMEEFKLLIESIGFKYNKIYDNYAYEEFRIYLWKDVYTFHNGSNWFNNIPLNDLTPILKLIRSYKLKQILR